MSTRERLLTAAKELLWERGYEAMSPRAVQERSGAGQGSFYHHFAGKADLAAAALSEVAAEMQEDLKEILYTHQPPLERVRAYLRMPREALRGCRLGRLTQEQILGQEPLRHPLASYFLWSEQAIAAALEQAQQEGTLSPTMNATEIAAALVAVVQGGYVVARALQDPQQMDRALHGALALLDAIERR